MEYVCAIMSVHVPEYGIYSFVFYDYPVFIFIFFMILHVMCHQSIYNRQ